MILYFYHKNGRVAFYSESPVEHDGFDVFKEEMHNLSDEDFAKVKLGYDVSFGKDNIILNKPTHIIKQEKDLANEEIVVKLKKKITEENAQGKASMDDVIQLLNTLITN